MNAARQASIVAFYGNKPAPLARLIALCCQKVKDALQEEFLPYEIEQIHATVVGVERASNSRLCNLNFQRYRQVSIEMDVLGFLKYLSSRLQIPFSVQVGGFADRDYHFTSQNERPYQRSFSVQGDKVVLMGWPRTAQVSPDSSRTAKAHGSALYPNVLNEIRRAAQAYGILHAYHRHASDIDNDLYFRIGRLKSPQLSESTLQMLEADLREFLRNEGPVITELGMPDLAIASYKNESLPRCSTAAWPLGALDLRNDLWKLLYGES